MKNINKKLYCIKVLIATVALVLSNAVIAANLTVVSFGGAYGAAQKKHMIDPYEKASKHTILFEDYTGGIAELKAQVESGNVTWDVLDMEYIDVERACSEGLLETLDLKQLPKGDNGATYSKDFIPNSINECAVGNIVWATVVGYDAGKKAPKTIKDFFNLKKFPGKRGMRKRAQVNVEWALMADGVRKKDVYKVLSTKAGVERAFRKLDTIKKDIIWFDSWSQAPQLLNDGSVSMTQSANGRLYSSIKEDGANFGIMWDGQVWDLDGWSIPKGSKNKEAAFDFIKQTTRTVPLAGMQDVAYGPTRKSSEKLIAKSVKKDLPSSHLSKGIKADAVFWADNGATLAQRFTAWSIR